VNRERKPDRHLFPLHQPHPSRPGPLKPRSQARAGATGPRSVALTIPKRLHRGQSG
jgi:hypothetical protein